MFLPRREQAPTALASPPSIGHQMRAKSHLAVFIAAPNVHPQTLTGTPGTQPPSACAGMLKNRALR
jgi:hypothetical protein